MSASILEWPLRNRESQWTHVLILAEPIICSSPSKFIILTAIWDETHMVLYILLYGVGFIPASVLSVCVTVPDTLEGYSWVPTPQSAAEVSKAPCSINGHRHTLACLDKQNPPGDVFIFFHFFTFVSCCRCGVCYWMTDLPVGRGSLLQQV